MKEFIDDLDSKIITLLEKNGRIPNTDLAKKLRTSETTVRKRIKRLIDEDLIKVVAVRNRSKLACWSRYLLLYSYGRHSRS